jgi:hypothetical protein
MNELQVDDIVTQKEKKDTYTLLHTLWTKAVGTEGYNKKEWQKLNVILSQKGLI